MVTCELYRDYTINAGGARFGFVEATYNGFETEWSTTAAYLGPFGVHEVPFSAPTGCGLLLAAFVIMAGVAVMLARRISARCQPQRERWG
jgi:hypothetical protein